MRFILYFFISVLGFHLFTACSDNPKIEFEEEVITLNSVFKDNFHIGAALNRAQINGEDEKATNVILNEFNSITPENIMKWMHIHPKPDSFDYEAPDKFVELGEANNMFIVGHTLVWHSQQAPWVHEIKDSTEMMNKLKHHIDNIVGRYKGRVHGWDVLNEALNDDGTLRNTNFLEVAGEAYIQHIFEWASAADPAAELYYNDYSMCNPSKRAGAIALAKKLQMSGAKISGIGMQAHWDIESPSLEEIEESIIAYSELGLKVHITELDVNVLPNPWDLKGSDVDQNYEGSEFMDPYRGGIPDSIQTKLTKRWEDIFRIFVKHQDKISRITFWGVNDGQSWKNDWPIKGRTNYPLLFDRDFKPKEAYHKILNLKNIGKA